MGSPPNHGWIARRVDRRRGALLLLVLSMLTLFLMIGTLMLVLATRARTTARAFADVISEGGLANLAARDLLDEALMVLLRGRQPSPAPAPPPKGWWTHCATLFTRRRAQRGAQRGARPLQGTSVAHPPRRHTHSSRGTPPAPHTSGRRTCAAAFLIATRN